MRIFAAALALSIACAGSESSDPAPTAQDPPVPREPAPPDAALAPPGIEEFSFRGDLGAALVAAGAVPAWEAVIDRHRWLERRGSPGAIWGRLGAADGEHRWLIDDSQGAGSLAARVSLPVGIALAEGDRVLLHGAWVVDQDRRWNWRVSGAARLPAAAESDPDPLAADAPGHVVGTIGDGVIDAASVGRVGNSGGAIWFEVVRGPRRPGDGWLVADRSHFAPAAQLLLPGERDPYGGQDYMTPDELWSLDKKTRYLVRIGRSRPPRKEGELRVLRALTPPKRLDPKASP